MTVRHLTGAASARRQDPVLDVWWQPVDVAVGASRGYAGQLQPAPGVGDSVGYRAARQPGLGRAGIVSLQEPTSLMAGDLPSCGPAGNGCHKQ